MGGYVITVVVSFVAGLAFAFVYEDRAKAAFAKEQAALKAAADRVKKAL